MCIRDSCHPHEADGFSEDDIEVYKEMLKRAKEKQLAYPAINVTS